MKSDLAGWVCGLIMFACFAVAAGMESAATGSDPLGILSAALLFPSALCAACVMAEIES